MMGFFLSATLALMQHTISKATEVIQQMQCSQKYSMDILKSEVSQRCKLTYLIPFHHWLLIHKVIKYMYFLSVIKCF